MANWPNGKNSNGDYINPCPYLKLRNKTTGVKGPITFDAKYLLFP